MASVVAHFIQLSLQNIGGVFAFSQAKADEDKAGKGGNGGNESNSIEPYSYIYLPIPEVPLVCIVMSLVSLYFSNNFLKHGRIGVTAAWWILVCGVELLDSTLFFRTFLYDQRKYIAIKKASAISGNRISNAPCSAFSIP